MYENQVQNKPTAAYWLSLIGGILALLVGLVFILAGAVAGAYFTFGFGFAVIWRLRNLDHSLLCNRYLCS
jgi:uncharacterized integral membrane protein